MDEDVKEEIHSRETVCRVCACYAQLLIPIFDGEGLENSIPDKIGKHLPVKVAPSDVLPTQICYQCASTIISWHELTTTCVEAEHKLKTLFGDDDVNTSDVQMSPAGSRDDDADVCENLTPDSSHLGAEGPSSSNTETLTKDHHIEAEVTAKEDVEGEMPKDAEKERFIADITEDIDDVCVEVTENNLLVRESEKQFAVDHCYTRERQSSSETISNPQQERSQPTPRSVLRPIAPRPILPQPLVNFVQKPVVRPLQRRQNEAKTAGANPPSKIYILVNRKAENVRSPTKNSILVPIPPLQPIVSSSNQLILPKSAAQPIVALRKSSQTNISTQVKNLQQTPPITVVKKFKELTITRVPVGGAKKSPVKNVSKASLSVIRGGSYPCKVCSANFANEMVFKRHMYIAHNVKKHVCPLCKSAFGAKFDLDIHIRRTHLAVKPKAKYECKICNKFFDKTLDLRLHVREHSRRTISRLEQVIQDKKPILGVPITEKEAELLRDSYVRENNKDSFCCALCKKTWANLEKAVAHIRTHTKEYLYSCETCGQKFNTRGVMIRHMQVHQNKKPYACEYCDKSFSSKQNRDDHHRLHTKEVKTVCESCGDNLTSASMLYYHRKIHSGVNPYKCPYCEKAYAIRSLLKRHIRLHTGEKPHLCSVCGRGFKTSGQLRGHSAVHSDERPFSCDGCGASMKTKKYLNRHRAICPTLQCRNKSTT